MGTVVFVASGISSPPSAVGRAEELGFCWRRADGDGVGRLRDSVLGRTTSRVGLDAPSLPTASRARTCTTWVLESLNQCRLARGLLGGQDEEPVKPDPVADHADVVGGFAAS